MIGGGNIKSDLSGGIAPMNVQNIKVKAGNGKITLTWQDPEDTYDGKGPLLCTWKGTKVVYKAGAYPTSQTDGILAVDNQTRGAYATNGFEINGLTNGVTYYFQLFPYSDKNVYNKNEANRITGAPTLYKIMTVIIDQNNSNPETCCTYADDAIAMAPGSSEWDDFFGHYPVMLLNGVEGKKLNRNDFTKHEDGTSADIRSGAEGDVMIACPRRGIKITTLGSIITVSMTDDPNDPNFEYNAHTRGSASKDIFYLGVYKGYLLSDKLRSLSGKKPDNNKTIAAFRLRAQENGKSNGTSSGYEQSGWFQLIFRQVMYLLKFKNLSSQNAIGYGYAASSNSTITNTGGTNAYGMDSEIIKTTNPSYMTDGRHQVKCLGWEDFWGNIGEWIEGLATDNNYNIMTTTTGFNNNRTNYENQGKGSSGNVIGYISKVQGSTKTGFLVKEASGSETTYFGDSSGLNASSFATFGGIWNNASDAGAFLLSVRNSDSSCGSGLGARLMYL